ncbi:Mobile element protein [Leuconostoc gelidum subsp. gasicomitatum]|nr:Mobile element protein [Leuconostoc gasicomitatum]
MNIHARIKYSAQSGQYIATKKRFRMGQGILLTPELKELIEHWITVEHWASEQIAGNVQDVELSSSTIRDWSKRGLIDIRTHKDHRQDVSPKERELARTQRDR